MKRDFINILKSILVSATLIFSAVSCSDDIKDNNGGPDTNARIKITATDSGVTVSEDGTAAYVVIPSTGGEVNLKLEATSAWDLINREDDWCVLTGKDDRITVSAPEFVSDYTRTTMFRIVIGDYVVGQIHVSQDGTEVTTLELSSNDVVIPETGGSETITVTTNKEWDVTGFEDYSWMSVTKGDGFFTVTAVRNDVPYEFTATLTVTSGKELNTKTEEVEVTLEPWSPAYLYFDRELLVIPEEGGVLNVRVFSNREWEVSGDDNWLSAERQGNEAVITVPAASSVNLEAELEFQTISGKDYAEAVLPVRLYTNPFTLEYTISANELTIGAAVSGNLNCYIDWGDGNSETFVGNQSRYSAIEHSYETAGVYQVKIYGTAETISTVGMERESSESITALISWGNLGVTDWGSGFANTNIREIPTGYQNILPNATDLAHLFQYCSRLESIPADLFNNLQVDMLIGSFFGCTSLKEIPADLFKGSSNIYMIPSLFRECTSLKSIPEGLFDDLTELENITAVFGDNTGLVSVPVNLFDNCRKLTDFNSAFGGCTSLTGPSPYTTINGVDVHLWERENYPAEFSEPMSYGGCFAGCTKLDDYGQIPASWR